MHVFHLKRKTLKRALSTADLFAVGYGDVGSSIYYALGVTAFYALGATPLAILLAGMFFICTALTYAEMATTFPKESGGSATFTRHAFNDLISFIAGWGLLLDYIVTTTISAYAIPPYLKSLLNFCHIPYNDSVPIHLTAVAIIISGLCALNIWGVKESSRFNFILMVCTIVSQAIIILLAGIFFLNLPFIIDHMRINVPNADWSPNWSEFLKGTAMAMVAYTGIESIAQLAAETKQPTICIPRAIRRVIFAVLFIYMGLSTIGLSIISPKELGTTYVDDPILGIVHHFPVGGEFLAPWVGLIAAIILLVASNAGLLGASRLIFSMSDYYQIPKFFHKLHATYRTPHRALILFSILSILVAVASQGQMLFLADIYNFGAQIAFFFAHLSLISLRIKKPNLPRPYRAPLNIPIGRGRSVPLTAILGCMAAFAVWCLVVWTKVEGRWIGLAWITIGLIAYLRYRKEKAMHPTGTVTIERIEVPGYQLLAVKKILVLTQTNGHLEALRTAAQLAQSHKAHLTIISILEIPPSLPLDEPLLKQKEVAAELSLQQAEALVREYHLSPLIELIRARSADAALLSLIRESSFDIAVIGTGVEQLLRWSHFAVEMEKNREKTPCKLILCKE